MFTTRKEKSKFAPFNDQDQWSEIVQVLVSIQGQVEVASRALSWMNEENLSCDGLADAVIVELYVLNKGDLFDYNRRYIDLEQRSITDDFPRDTRHAVSRLIAKASSPPKQRLQRKLIDFHMWFDLAMKCREARRQD